jgi:diguanylate cyclase (GGDEF)-like protein
MAEFASASDPSAAACPEPDGSTRAASEQAWVDRIEHIRQSGYSDPVVSESLAAAALDEAQRSGRLDLACQLLRLLGLSHAYQSRLVEAAGWMQRAVDMARSIHRADHEAQALSSLGAVHAQISDFATAMECFERALDLIRHQPGSPSRDLLMASVLNNFGAIQVEMGAPERALPLFEEAHALYSAADRTFDANLTLSNAAGAHAMNAEILSNQRSVEANFRAMTAAQRAREIANESIAALANTESRESASLWARINLARALTVLGEFTHALDELQHVEDLLADGVDRPYFGIEICTLRARALRMHGRAREAVQELTAKLAAVANVAHAPGDRTLLLKELVAAQEASGNLAAALQSFREYHEWTLRVRDQAAELRGQVLNARLDVERARHRAEVERVRAEGLELRNEQLAVEAQIDALTGLPNRRAIDAAMAHRIADEQRRFACVLADVDRFKTINDGYSHQTGDAVLRRIGALLRDAVREGDIAARYGGEEFLLLLNEVDADQVTQICERLRMAIATEPWPQDRGALTVTVSIGGALRRPGESASSLVARADAGLYAAKASGRNRVVIDSRTA